MRPWLLALVIVGGGALGCTVDFEHGLDEEQANQITALLDQSGFAADKASDDTQPGTFKITLARSEVPAALVLISDHGLPRRGQKGLAESFANEGLVPSAIGERARYAGALAADLERTLEGLPGVVNARVHLALADSEAAPPSHASAAVLLRTAGGLSVSESDVQKLVSGAVPELALAEVHVVVAGRPAATAAAAPEVELDHVGPLIIAKQSRSTLTAFAGGGLALLLGLGIALVYCALQLGALRRRLRATEPR